MLLQALMSLSLSNLIFSLFLVIMARTKRTPKNPQLHRPVTAIGKDVQPPRKCCVTQNSFKRIIGISI